MKVIIIFSLIAYATAASLYGTSTQTRSQDDLGNYSFGYDEKHETGGSFRKESGNSDRVTGSYGLTLADGRVRTVHYIADENGFRPSISSNEPGFDEKAPAATLIARSDTHTLMDSPVAPVYSAFPATFAFSQPSMSLVAREGPVSYSTSITH